MAKKSFSVGDEVVHKLFGEGIIVEVDSLFEDTTDDTKLTIEFKGKDRKQIIAKFVKHVAVD